MCVYTWIHISIVRWIFIYMYVRCLCTRRSQAPAVIYIYMYVYINMHRYVCVYKHNYLLSVVYWFILICDACARGWAQSPAAIHIYMCMCIWILQFSSVQFCTLYRSICVHIDIYVYIWIICVHMDIYVYIQIYMCTYGYICVHVDIYVYIWIYIPFNRCTLIHIYICCLCMQLISCNSCDSNKHV